jgi:hypothetical protein
MMRPVACLLVMGCGGNAAVHSPSPKVPLPPTASNRDEHSPRVCFRGETTWSSSGEQSQAPAWMSITFERPRSRAQVRWIWSNPGDRSHPVVDRHEVWHIDGTSFVIDDGDPSALGTSYTGQFIDGEPWRWNRWRTEIVAPPIHTTSSYEWRDGHLRSEGRKIEGVPRAGYSYTEDQRDDLAEIPCEAWDHDVATLATQ